MNASHIRGDATKMGPTPAVQPCWVVIPSLVQLSSDKSDCTTFFFFARLFFVMVDLLEQQSLRLSAISHVLSVTVLRPNTLINWNKKNKTNS